MTRRGVLERMTKGAAVLALSLLAEGGVPPKTVEKQQSKTPHELVGMLEDLLGGQHPISLTAQSHTYANLHARIENLEGELQRLLAQDPQGKKAPQIQSMVVILRLLFARLENVRREEIAQLSGAPTGDMHNERENLSVLLATELHHFTTLFHHMRTAADILRATEFVPQMPKAQGTDAQNAFLREAYASINTQGQQCLAEPLEHFWRQMSMMETLTALDQAIVAAKVLLQNPAQIRPQERDALIDSIFVVRASALPQPDGAAVEAAQKEAIRALQTMNPQNVATAQAALGRLRDAVFQATETLANTQKGYLHVEPISIFHVAIGADVDDYRATVSLTDPGKKDVKEGRLGTAVIAALSIERMHALHQQIVDMQARRGDSEYEAKLQALEYAYECEMGNFLRTHQRGMQDIAWRKQVTSFRGEQTEVLGREHDAETPEDSPEVLRKRAADERRALPYLEEQLRKSPENRAKLEAVASAWRSDGYAVFAGSSDTELSASYMRVEQELRRIFPGLVPPLNAPEKTKENFRSRARRFLSQMGVVHVAVTPPSLAQKQALRQQQVDYAQGIVRSAQACMDLTDPNKATGWETVEGFADASLLRFSSTALIDRAIHQAPTVPWELELAYACGIQYVHLLTVSHWMGVDLREVHKGNQSYFGYRVKLPAFSTLILLGKDLDKKLKDKGLTKDQLRALPKPQQQEIFAELAQGLKDQQTTTVLNVKKAHAPAMRVAGTHVIAATTLIQTAIDDLGIAELSECPVEYQYVDFPESLEKQAGNLVVMEALIKLREHLGHDPFERLQEACDRQDEVLTNYRAVLRQPAGDWWQDANGQIQPSHVVKALKERKIRLTTEELLWLYTTLLPVTPSMGIPQPQLLQEMRDHTAKARELETRLHAGNLSAAERTNLLEQLFTARGHVRSVWLYLAAHEQLAQDHLTFAYGDYMTDLQQSLGLHMNVAAALLSVGDHRTAAAMLLAMRAVEIAGTVTVVIQGLKRMFGGRTKKEQVPSDTADVTLDLDAKISTERAELERLQPLYIAAGEAYRNAQGALDEGENLRAVLGIVRQVLAVIARLENLLQGQSLPEDLRHLPEAQRQLQAHEQQYAAALRNLEEDTPPSPPTA